MGKKIILVLICGALLLSFVVVIDILSNSSDISFEIIEAEPDTMQSINLCNITEVSGLLSVDTKNSQLRYWTFDDSFNVYDYNYEYNEKELIYKKTEMEILAYISNCDNDIIYCNVTYDDTSLYFQLIKVVDSNEEILYEDEASRIPYISLMDNRYIILNYEKGNDRKIESYLKMYDLSEAGIMPIANETLYVEDEGKYTGKYLVYADGSNGVCYYQCLNIEKSEIENAKEAEVYEYSLANGKSKLLLDNNEILLYIGGNGDFLICSNYYYDIPDGIEEVSSLYNINNHTYTVIPKTYVAYEIENVQWLDTNKCFMYNTMYGYLIDFKNREGIYWQYDMEENYYSQIYADENAISYIYNADNQYILNIYYLN